MPVPFLPTTTRQSGMGLAARDLRDVEPVCLRGAMASSRFFRSGKDTGDRRRQQGHKRITTMQLKLLDFNDFAEFNLASVN